MASGNKRMQINTRERLVSTDHNRLQAFAAEHVAELFRAMLLSFAGEAQATSAIGATTSPLFALILSGLYARPEIGTTNCFVEPGSIAMINPDAVPSSDDSPCKVFKDDGVQIAGQLTLTPGGGGATRIDVIECSRIEQIEESDNRDIFNPATGLFAPALVDKVVSDRLTYRIRTGTPGGGFPGTASGWLPLAVASVPNTATTWNDCVVWDVRPLLGDLVRAPLQLSQTFPHSGLGYATASEVSGGNRKLRGVIETSKDQWRLGGEIGPALSGFAGGALDLLSSDVLEPGFAVTPSAPWFLYFMTPFGLPRWARYSPSSVGIRSPTMPRGIPVFTQKGPGTNNGKPGSAVTLPTPLGLGGSSTDGALALSGLFDTGGNFVETILADNWCTHGLGASALNILPAAGAGTSVVRYDLTDNVHYPNGATAIRLRFFTTMTGAVTTAFRMTRFIRELDDLGATLIEKIHTQGNISDAGGLVVDVFEIELPLHVLTNMPSGTGATRQFQLAYSLAGLSPTYSLQSVQVVGWRLRM